MAICLEQGANFIKIQIGLTFWCWLTQVVVEEMLLNRCVSLLRRFINYIILNIVCLSYADLIISY